MRTKPIVQLVRSVRLVSTLAKALPVRIPRESMYEDGFASIAVATFYTISAPRAPGSQDVPFAGPLVTEKT